MNENYLHSSLTDLIIKCYFTVYNRLGYGFLEKVYENSLKIELESQGLIVEVQKPIKVIYKGCIVGDYYADMVVNSLVIVELKACETLNASHQFQLQNYLKATEMEVGLLLNFGKKPEFSRKVFTKQYKVDQ
ncbi:MAG: GxxExxY protein [Candidatus Cloacimonas sp.]|jgi:GxxExxY protein|nr:GxxExxY protein [Candidatus Cloacimonas sp.]